jgi:hypothetical protein
MVFARDCISILVEKLSPHVPPHPHSSKTTCAPAARWPNALDGATVSSTTWYSFPSLSTKTWLCTPGGRRFCFAFEGEALESEIMSDIVGFCLRGLVNFDLLTSETLALARFSEGPYKRLKRPLFEFFEPMVGQKNEKPPDPKGKNKHLPSL